MFRVETRHPNSNALEKKMASIEADERKYDG